MDQILKNSFGTYNVVLQRCSIFLTLFKRYGKYIIKRNAQGKKRAKL